MVESGDMSVGDRREEESRESPASAVLYKRLLALHTHDDPEPMLDDVVKLIVELTGAQLCLVQLFPRKWPMFWRGHGATPDEIDALRESISTGIVQHAMETVLTASARGDARFANLDSVSQRENESVLCAVVGADPVLGVVYLQGRSIAGAFGDGERELVELTASHLAKVGPRLAERRHLLDTLARHGWNVAAAARDLAMARSHLYVRLDQLGLRRSG